MNKPLIPITDLGSVATSTLLLRPDEASISVRAEPVEASAARRQAQGERFINRNAESLVQQEALASYELSKSRGNRARGLELLDKLDAHFQTAA